MFVNAKVEALANIPNFPGTGFPPVGPSPGPSLPTPSPGPELPPPPHFPTPIEPDPYPDYRDIPPITPIDAIAQYHDGWSARTPDMLSDRIPSRLRSQPQMVLLKTATSTKGVGRPALPLAHAFCLVL